MSRRKARKPRRQRPQGQGRVFVRDESWPEWMPAVQLPGVTSAEYDRVQELARAGAIHDPLVMKFVRSFAELIGSQAAEGPWTSEDLAGFLRWLGFVPEDAWTAVDDAELQALLQGEGASGV